MAMTAVPSIAVEIDDVAASISPLVTSAFVMLRSGALGDSATVEIDDPAGSAVLPRQDAGIRIAVADIEIFRGSIVRASGSGDEKGRTLRIFSAAKSHPPTAGRPALACVWGQNLVSWNLTARLETPPSADPQEDATVDAGILTLTMHPALRPGMTVTVAGVGARFDGDYIVDTVGHKFNLATGYSTALRVRRPSAGD